MQKDIFLHGFDQELNKVIICNIQDKQFDLFSDIFRIILDHHAPLKTKRIRDNQDKCMTKELSEFFINRSRYNNMYQKLPAHENSQTYKKAKNLCNTLSKKATKTYFEKETENVIMVTKKF